MIVKYLDVAIAAALIAGPAAPTSGPAAAPPAPADTGMPAPPAPGNARDEAVPVAEKPRKRQYASS
jgi:hypothetical protein